MGHVVELYAAQNIFYDFYYKSLWHKLFYRLGLSSILKKINNSLLSKVANQRYDLIWVFKGMEIFPETLKVLIKHTDKLVNFNPDNPFIFSGSGSGNRNISKSIHLYDLHLTYDSWVKGKIQTKFKIKSEILPFGFDEKVISGSELMIVDEILAVCFLGNPDNYRASIIKSLLEQNIEVHLYGNNWSRFVHHPLAVIHTPVYGLDLYITLRKYRVQLNIMRKHNLNSHNMRSMEIPGVGGVMLAPQTQDHVAFFELNEEIFTYTDNSSLALQAQRILSMEKHEVENVRIQARNKVLQQFTYCIQTKHILSLLDEA